MLCFHYLKNICAEIRVGINTVGRSAFRRYCLCPFRPDSACLPLLASEQFGFLFGDVETGQTAHQTIRARVQQLTTDTTDLIHLINLLTPIPSHPIRERSREGDTQSKKRVSVSRGLLGEISKTGQPS